MVTPEIFTPELATFWKDTFWKNLGQGVILHGPDVCRQLAGALG
jgi:hypothetical protein